MSVVSKQYVGEEIIVSYESSNIKGGKYNTNTKKLEVTFNNGLIYEYDDVPHEIFAELNLSESQGRYFNKNISKNYTFRKI